jgi:hypothetical protein
MVARDRQLQCLRGQGLGLGNKNNNYLPISSAPLHPRTPAPLHPRSPAPLHPRSPAKNAPLLKMLPIFPFLYAS